jgi:hypothetical protein
MGENTSPTLDASRCSFGCVVPTTVRIELEADGRITVVSSCGHVFGKPIRDIEFGVASTIRLGHGDHFAIVSAVASSWLTRAAGAEGRDVGLDSTEHDTDDEGGVAPI